MIRSEKPLSAKSDHQWLENSRSQLREKGAEKKIFFHLDPNSNSDLAHEVALGLHEGRSLIGGNAEEYL